MNGSMHEYMKVGIVHFMAFPTTIKGEGPIRETVHHIAKDDYFDAIEITWIKDEAVRKDVKKIIDTSGMAVSYGAQPRLLTTGLNINDLDEAKRREAINTLKCGIDEAYEMNCTGFAFLSGKYEEATKHEAYQALVRSLHELCDYSRSKGSMPVILEIFDYDIDKKSLIGPTSLALQLAEEICETQSNFGLMVDLSHIPMYYETIEAAILPIKNHIRHVHIGNTVICDKDCEAYGDMHPRFGFPNSENGIPEIASYLRCLLDAGILNPLNPPFVSFEVKPWGDEDPELIISNAKRALNRAWALV